MIGGKSISIKKIVSEQKTKKNSSQFPRYRNKIFKKIYQTLYPRNFAEHKIREVLNKIYCQQIWLIQGKYSYFLTKFTSSNLNNHNFKILMILIFSA